MRLLLDTHALLWWAHEPEKLSQLANEAIGDGANEILVSAVSAMEITTKNRLGRLEYASPLAGDFLLAIASLDFSPLPITCAHAERAGKLTGFHKDPWDRLLAAQALIEQMPLVTVDPQMASWHVRVLW